MDSILKLFPQMTFLQALLLLIILLVSYAIKQMIDIMRKLSDGVNDGATSNKLILANQEIVMEEQKNQGRKNDDNMSKIFEKLGSIEKNTEIIKGKN